VNHGISTDLRERVLEESRNFFNLSEDEKEALSVAYSNSYRGYLCDDVKNTLQIRPKGGTEEWMTVDPIDGGFLCNIGDMLMECAFFL
jgi:isopenicillin N synthase-like dioxygenase